MTQDDVYLTAPDENGEQEKVSGDDPRAHMLYTAAGHDEPNTPLRPVFRSKAGPVVADTVDPNAEYTTGTGKAEREAVANATQDDPKAFAAALVQNKKIRGSANKAQDLDLTANTAAEDEASF